MKKWSESDVAKVGVKDESSVTSPTNVTALARPARAWPAVFIVRWPNTYNAMDNYR